MKDKRHVILFRLALFFCLLISTSLSAQTTKSVSGTVLDGDSEPIIGASVSVKGTTAGTVTDLDGNFSLSGVPDNAVLQVSYVGYVSQEIATSGRTSFNIVLKEDNRLLDEVVVIGYGSQTKKELTGSIASLKAEDFNKGVFNGAAGLLQGKVAGLTISKDAGGDPNNREYKIQMRGTGSLKGTASPLYIIDGVPGGSLNSINPNDIESMDILKDGSAAAIYGTRANAGVIIITTKKGRKDGNSNIEYSGSIRVDQIAGSVDLMNAQEFAQYGGPVLSSASTDWLKQITRTPINHEHNLSMAGGSNKLSYRASLSFKDNQGLAINSEYREWLGRFSVDQKALNNMLDLSYNLSYNSAKNSWVTHDAFQQALHFNPTAPVYADPTDSNYEKYGHYYQDMSKNGQFNPLSMIEQVTDDGQDQTMLGSFRATLNILPQFKVGTFASYQKYNQITGRYVANNSFWDNGVANGGVAKKGHKTNLDQMIETTLQYTDAVGQHNFSAIAGHAYQYFEEEDGSYTQTGFGNNLFSYNNMKAGEGLKELTTGKDTGVGMESWKKSSKLQSFFGRVIYNYNSRYFLNASVRYEGSSRFGTDRRWAIFPAVSGSWLISDESFLKGNKAVSYLKLRVGYGVTGNVPDEYYPWIGRMAPQDDYFYDAESEKWIQAWSLVTNPNTKLQWEQKTEINVGVDFGFLKDRITGTIDLYNRETSDLLYTYDVDASKYPANTMLLNYGVVRNQGIELTLNGTIIQQKDFTFGSTLVLSTNSNKLIKFKGDGKIIKDPNPNQYSLGAIAGMTGVHAQYLQEGEAIGNFYGFKFSHIDENGEWYGYDRNDEVKKFSQLALRDRQILGNALPLLNWGFGLFANYKNFDANCNLRGAIGGKLLNMKRLAYASPTAISYGNMMKHDDNHLVQAPRVMTDYYLESATYGKLGDVTLGYTWTPKDNIAKYIPKARVYLTGQNLLTITNYSGVDPEVNMSGLTPGIEELKFYPTVRSFILGVVVNF